MKYSLLTMTQRILESMDSDEVNSHADTIESKAVANIIRETYSYLVTRMDFPSVHSPFTLVPSGDSTKPTLMSLPANVLDIDYIKYKNVSDGDSKWLKVKFCDLEEYLNRTLDLQETDANVETMTIPLNGSNVTFKFYNDRDPTTFTTIDDTIILFDAYNSTEDNTLQGAKTLCYGRLSPEFLMQDSFVPKLDEDQFQLLLNEAKSQAFIELKQMSNAHSERRAAKLFVSTQRQKRNVPTGQSFKRPGYGKRRV